MDEDDLLINPDENDLLMINESILDEDDDEVSTTFASARDKTEESSSTSQEFTKDSILKDVISPLSGKIRKSITVMTRKVPIMKNKIVTAAAGKKMSTGQIPRKTKAQGKHASSSLKNIDNKVYHNGLAEPSQFSRPRNVNDPRPRLKVISSSVSTTKPPNEVKTEPSDTIVKLKMFERKSSGCYVPDSAKVYSIPISSPPPGRSVGASLFPAAGQLSKKTSTTVSINSSASSNSPQSQSLGFKATPRKNGIHFAKPVPGQWPVSSYSTLPTISAPGSISGDSKTPFRFGSVQNGNTSANNVSVDSNNPLEKLRLQHSRLPKVSRSVDQMNIEELEEIIAKKKSEAAMRMKLEEEMMMTDMGRMEDTMSGMTANPMIVMMRQQMAMLEQQRREMAETFRKMEERRQMEELKSSITQLTAMVASGDGRRPLAMGKGNQVKGSVKARVGPRNRVNEGAASSSSNIKSRISAKADFLDDDSEDRGKKRKYTNSRLPEDLVLTNITQTGPKPALKRIVWSDEEEEVEDYCNWKRGKRSDN